MKLTTRELIDLKSCLCNEDSRLCSHIEIAREWCFERHTIDSETLEKIEADVSEQRKPILSMLNAVSDVVKYRYAIERQLPFMPTPAEPSDETKSIVVDAYRTYASEIACMAATRERMESNDD